MTKLPEPSTTPPTSFRGSIAVVGTGPVGLLAALSLAHSKTPVLLIGPKPNLTPQKQNARTAALFPQSIQHLEKLGVWQDCRQDCEELKAIRLIDDLEDAIFSAPEVTFRAGEIGEANFGYNVPNDVLVRALWSTIQSHLKTQAQTESASQISFVETQAVCELEHSKSNAVLTTTEDLTIECQLVVGADGRNSICRTAAEIETKTWTYPQSALTCAFDHARDHKGISTEFHRQPGPCTTVPMPGRRSSLVWVDTPETTSRLQHMSDKEFHGSLSSRLHGHLGEISAIGPRAVFPLSGLTANTIAKNRVALVGEAAHVFPPIAAQGLNLGFRDVIALSKLIKGLTQNNLTSTLDPGLDTHLARYDSLRRADVTARVWSVDAMNRSLLTGLGGMHLLRGAGLHVLKMFPAIRRGVIRQGLSDFGLVDTR